MTRRTTTIILAWITTELALCHAWMIAELAGASHAFQVVVYATGLWIATLWSLFVATWIVRDRWAKWTRVVGVIALGLLGSILLAELPVRSDPVFWTEQALQLLTGAAFLRVLIAVSFHLPDDAELIRWRTCFAALCFAFAFAIFRPIESALCRVGLAEWPVTGPVCSAALNQSYVNWMLAIVCATLLVLWRKNWRISNG